MADINDYNVVCECRYKGEVYSVRDNGAVMRHAPVGGKVRPLDHQWMFGKVGKNNYLYISNIGVHRIVASAFHGQAPSDQHVVDHIDTNRHNNRPENLRWLTKLENVLNNEYTRRKIVHCCGSIEAFLENPSLLNGHEELDSSLAWMKAVTREEAAHCKVHIERWVQEDGGVRNTSGRHIGEWVYEESRQTVDTKSYEMSWDDLRTALGGSQSEPAQVAPVQRVYASVPAEGLPIYEKKVPKVLSLEECLKQVCERKGWDLQRNVVGKGWKADYLVTMGERKVVVNNHLTPARARTMTDRLNRNGMEVCWLVGSNRQKISDDVLYVEYKDGKIKVGSTVVKMEKFIVSLANGRVVHSTEFKVKYLHVFYWVRECYKCHREMVWAYMVKRYESENGAVVDPYYCGSREFDVFNPTIVGKVEEYFAEHPELKVHLNIKPRYSRTRDEEYLSFGCYHCDAIYGDHYYYVATCDLIYVDDPEHTIKIDVEDMGVVIDYHHWEVG